MTKSKQRARDGNSFLVAFSLFHSLLLLTDKQIIQLLGGHIYNGVCVCVCVCVCAVVSSCKESDNVPDLNRSLALKTRA